MAPEKPTNQRWRAPLRQAIAWLTAECHALYQREAPALLRDPEEALAGYGGVIGAGPSAVRSYAGAAAREGLAEDGRVRAAELLEMERGALRTLTSCAWFFDDIAGIETVQVLRYAAWVIELAGSEGPRLEEGLVSRLAHAESNYPTMGGGRQIYLQRARPHYFPPLRIAAGLTAARMLAPAAATSPAWELTGPTDAAQLVNRRTGRIYPMSVEVAEHGLDLTVTVRSPQQQAPVSLGLRELPERQRTALEAVLRGRVLARLLPSEDRAALERGDPLEPILRRALARRVRRLAEDRSDTSLGEVVDLLRLLEEQQRAVPFEVQTLFWNVWQGDAHNEPGMLELARRMGFDPTATAEPG